MHPTLFEIPLLGLPIRTYGVMMVIGFLAAAFFVRRKAAKEGMDPDLVFNLVFYIFFSGIIGARIFFVATNWNIYDRNLLTVFKVWDGGLVWYGGLIVATVFGIWYMHRKKLQVLQLSDIIIIGVTLGLAFGRLGCFSAGCCHGHPTNLPWGVVFPNIEENLIHPAYRGKIPLHPTQLYHTLNALLLFAVLNLFHWKKRFHGQVLCLFLLFYSVSRFALEFLRGDEARGFMEIAGIRLSTSQWIGILMFLLSAIGLWLLWKRKRNRD